MSQPDTLDFVQVGPPRGEARACVIWLHGLGADGHDFEPIVPELGLAPELGVRFVFPHAPSIPVALNGGMVMPAWYDIEEIDLRRRHDEAGIRRSTQQISALIDAERAAGVPDEKMVLAGFSQGGAIALFAGLRHPRKLAGILAMSAYLVIEETTATERSEANRTTSILQAHGDFDPMVPVARGAEARDRLTALGYSVDWHTYPMEHQVCLEEIQLVGSWLAGVLS